MVRAGFLWEVATMTFVAGIGAGDSSPSSARHLLTDGHGEANLLGSMCEGLRDASQRRVTRFMQCGYVVVEGCAVLRYSWTLRWLHPAHLT